MIGFFSWAEDAAVILFCIVLLLMGLYALYDSYLVYQQANDTSLLKYRPDYGGEAPEKPIKGNMVAWLTLKDSDVDYPVMQGATNSEYLNKNPFGEYSLSGSIFLDCRNAPDFSDAYALIYGHHMEGGVMFGALDAWMERTYFEQHSTGELIVGEKTYPLTVYAVLEAEATNKAIFAPTETDIDVTLAYIANRAVYVNEAVEPEGKKLLALSTCKYPDKTDRTIIVCVYED